MLVFIGGYLIINEIITLMTDPKTFNFKFSDFLRSPDRNPTTNPVAIQVLSD
jgi:hypothetical protein